MYKKFWVLPHFDNFFYFARNILPNNVDPDFPQARNQPKIRKTVLSFSCILFNT